MTNKSKAARYVFLATTAIVLVLSVLSYFRINSLIESGNLVNHTTEVKLELENVISSLREAEAMQRGFLLTHDSVFLKNYKSVVAEYPQHLNKLNKLIKDNPAQVKNLQAVVEIAGRRHSWMEDVLEKERQATITLNDFIVGKKIMDTLRNQVDLMNKIENGLLSERKKHLEQQIISAPVFLALLTVFSLCILLFAYRNVNSRIKELDAIRLELEQKNEALKEVNKDLESFAYISSHDLQEPLRKIRLFVDRLAEKEQDSISDEGKSYMVKIERAAKRMQQLIVDLLSFSKVTNKYEQFEDVDLRQLVSEVINELSEVIEEKEVTIEIGTMCNIQAIRYQIRQLMFNLIGNAIKFSKPYGKPHIKIVASHSFEDLKKDGAEKKQYCHVTISDNGVGFDAQYNDQIFQVFQRLHQKTKYEGTGIGLAIVKKVVENHNGYIEAHGKENEGATFDIWLPVG